MTVMILIIALLSLGITALLWFKLIDLQEQLSRKLDDNADNLSDQIGYQLETSRKEQELALVKQINLLQEQLYQQFSTNRDRSDQMLEKINQNLSRSVKDMQTSNEKRLDQMRQTVEEKLEQTLQTRLQASFETVSKQLESVNQGLGEMKSLAQDVGSLSKVLSNTKTRGILGEIQLGQIIEDIMTTSQYEREFATVSGSTERVEYAIKLPGTNQGDYVYLPIDSKFPLEDYYRLEEAYETGDKEEIERYRKSLLASIKRFAKDIQSKYLNPPETTNFGIMFLPTEGLYSEVVRHAAFFDSLRREEHIVIAGPSTISALLNSLSVGFKTLNIQKNADDISKILGNVKGEFGKFGGMLQKAQKQLSTASKTVDSLLTTRTNAIIKALNTVETYQDSATQSLLNLPISEEDE